MLPTTAQVSSTCHSSFFYNALKMTLSFCGGNEERKYILTISADITGSSLEIPKSAA
jgi:hypothetical protein